jgi:hypothetical protein
MLSFIELTEVFLEFFLNISEIGDNLEKLGDKMYSFSNTLHVLRDFLVNDMPCLQAQIQSVHEDMATLQKTLQGIQGELHKGKLDTRPHLIEQRFWKIKLKKGSNF